MLKNLTFVFAMLFGTAAFAADAQITKSFIVTASPDVVGRWIRQNPDAVLKSTHLDVLSRKADDVKVRKVTKKGNYEFKLRESMEEHRGSVIFTTKLIESYSGGIQDQVNRIYLEPSNKGTRVTVYMSASVNERRVRWLELRTNLSQSADGLEHFLKGKFH